MKIILVALLSVFLSLSGCSGTIETPLSVSSAPDNPQNTGTLPKPLASANGVSSQSYPFTIFRGFPSIYDKIYNTSFTNPSRPYIVSELRLFPFSRRVAGFMPCDGSMLPISSSMDLFSLIGETFGGDRRSNFAVPDFINKSPLNGLLYQICVAGAYPDAGPYSSRANPNGGINYCPITGTEYTSNLLISEVILAINADKKVPDYMIPCDGRKLKTDEYQALFVLFSNKFGGDAQSTFALPDLSSLQPPVAGASYYIVTEGIFPPSR